MKKIIIGLLVVYFTLYAEEMKMVEVSFGTYNSVDNEPLGFNCLSESQIILNIGSFKYIFDEGQKHCLIYEDNTNIITWKSRINDFKQNYDYPVSIIEQDLTDDDHYKSEGIFFSEENLLELKRGGTIEWDVDNNYFIRIRGVKPFKEQCEEDSFWFSWKSLIKTKENYITIDEKNILAIYRELYSRGINQSLSVKFDQLQYLNLKNAPAEIAYMNHIISGLKRVQKGLKQQNTEELEKYLNQTKYLMYAWTLPFEILATKNIVKNSLLGGTQAFYDKEIKTVYEAYNKLISSLASLKNKQDIEAEFQTAFEINPCNNLEETLKTREGMLPIIFSKNESGEQNYSIIFDIPFEDMIEVTNLDNITSDEWYHMIRVYVTLQDQFYETKKEIEKILNILKILPNTENQTANLQKELISIDNLYRKLNDLARYNIFGLPISIYLDLYTHELNLALDGINDEERIREIAISFNKTCANMQNYIVNEDVLDKLLNFQKSIKKEFDDEEWKEVKTRAKLTKDWLRMLEKVKTK